VLLQSDMTGRLPAITLTRIRPIGVQRQPCQASASKRLAKTDQLGFYESKAHGKNTHTFSQAFPEVKQSNGEWIKFEDTHLIGIAEIDEQHRLIVQLVNRFNRRLSTGNCSDTEIKGLFDELVKFTVYHFECEHNLMQQFEYPGLAEHDQEHESLTNELISLGTQLNKGMELLILQRVKDWLMGHISGSDKVMGAFINLRRNLPTEDGKTTIARNGYLHGHTVPRDFINGEVLNNR
jgi:hemerythrin-like metal-binding protein